MWRKQVQTEGLLFWTLLTDNYHLANIAACDERAEDSIWTKSIPGAF